MAGLVYWLWPRLDLPRLGREEVWFALGWLFMLAAPALLHLLPTSEPQDDFAHTMQAEACGQASQLAAGLFVALLIVGEALGNYKLWLGIIYLGGVTMRLAGLFLRLRVFMLTKPHLPWLAALAAAAIGFLSCLLIIPWVKPGLVAIWPPVWAALTPLLINALFWGGITGAVLVLLGAGGRNRRLAWLATMAVGMGPGPALAMTWFEPWPLAVTLAVLAGLTVLRNLRGAAGEQPAQSADRPLPLYWLLRALMILWWACGLAVVLASAWWQPNLGDLFTGSAWLRAVGLGTLLVLCLGVLGESSIPLLGRPAFMGLGSQRKVLGILLSSLALLWAISPLALGNPPAPSSLGHYLKKSRAELLSAPVTLDQNLPQLDLTPPAWLNNLSYIFVVGHMEDGSQVPQGSVVAMLVAIDSRENPMVFSLRAGIDTADRDLAKRNQVLRSRHQKAAVADMRTTFTATGESYPAYDYYSGLFLRRKVERLAKLRIRMVYQAPPGDMQPRLTLTRIFAY